MSILSKKDDISYLCASKNYSVPWFYGEMNILLLYYILFLYVQLNRIHVCYLLNKYNCIGEADQPYKLYLISKTFFIIQ